MLKGKTAVVTGGSRGIGAAVVRKLASLHADIAVIYAGNEEKANEICTFCREQYGVNAISYRCDVGSYDAVKETVAQIKADFGGVQILVNNAGITRDGLIAVMKEADIDDVLTTNLKGALNMTRFCAPLMIRGKYGRIINISSVAGLMGNAGQANYSAAKAGLIGLTKSTARELAPRGITCNAVAPGFVETDMTKSLPLDSDTIAAQIPLGRIGKPEEIAEAAAFLILSGYITGEVLRVDGGIAC